MSSGDSLLRYLPCAAGNETFYIDMAFVDSVLRQEDVHWTKGSGGAAGTFIRGQEDISIFRLDALLGLPGGQTVPAHERVVLIHGAGRTWGLAVDRVDRVIEVQPRFVSPLPAAAGENARRLCPWVVRHHQALSLILDAAALLDRSHRPEPARDTVPSATLNLSAAAPRLTAGDLVLCGLGPAAMSGGAPVRLGLTSSQVLEILHPLPATPIPGSPDFMLGLVQWRQKVVPVVDVQARLGLKPLGSSPLSRLMIIAGPFADAPAGLLLDPDIRVQKLPVDHRGIDPLALAHLPAIRGAVELGGEIVLIPHLGTLLLGQPDSLVR